MSYFKPTIIVLAASLLWGCAGIQQKVTEAPPPEPEPAPEAPAPIALEPAKPQRVRAFPIETFYSLLVAEMAGSRGRYDVELGNYIQEAHRTRDPGVTAQATRIARYLNANQAALSTAQLWVELEPDNPEALYIAATELAGDGQLLDAFKHSEKLLELGSTPIFQNIAARAGQATDTQRESLLTDFDRLLRQYPEDLQLLIGKGLLLQQDGQLEQALTQAQLALAVQDDDVAAVILEARLLHQLDRAEEALTRLLALLQQDPRNQRLRLQYARMLTNIDLEEAQEQFEVLVRQSPNDGELLLALALIANEVGNEPLARNSLQRLLDMDEQSDSAHFYLGRIEAEAGDTDAALEHYLQVRRGQDFLPALGQAIDILVGRGDLVGAAQKMDEMRGLHPSGTEQFYLMEAQVLARHQHLDAAEALLTEALTLHPTNTDLLYSRAMINEQRHMNQLTERDVRAVIKYQPNNAAALNALGYTLADRTDRYEEAYQLINQALNIEPDDPAIIDSMGWVQYRLGNYDEALLRLREAMKAFPDHEIAAHLGEVLWVTGETEEARTVWEEGLELNPDSDIIPRVMQRLDAGI
ncbi:MAG: tetratricopeptide repeat protein [Cellvibrionaceae bacterium]